MIDAKSHWRYDFDVGKEKIMTMTYDGAMVMPKNFVAVNSDEMEYVDGGIQVTTGWLGVYVRLTGSETTTLTNYSSVPTTIIAGALGVASKVLAVSIGALWEYVKISDRMVR